ncbi:MAG: GreA/GreB family elongation factor [Bacteriovorax sp.]
MLDKKLILAGLIENLQKELSEVESAANSAKDLATQDDLKSEGKYDTRAIEASYLASAQQKRVEEIKIDIQMLEEIELMDSDRLQMGSLALIEYKGQARYYFLTSTSGGTMLTIEGHPVLVISVFSPLGSEALGLEKGESFEVETPKEMRSYKILEVY